MDKTYRVIDELGRGGQAEVYLVERTDNGKRFAVKVLSPEYVGQGLTPTHPLEGLSAVQRMSDLSVAQRFAREGDLMRRLSHPGIAKGYGIGNIRIEENLDLPYYVLEYVEGIVLDDDIMNRCEERGLVKIDVGEDGGRYLRYMSPDEKPSGLLDPLYPVEEAVEITLKLLDALTYLHRLSGQRDGAQLHSIHHRDVKPENAILQRTNGVLNRLVLLDLGICSITSHLADYIGIARTLTKAGCVIGTPHFMSPEQLSGKPTDARADVYATGLIFFMCLTGLQPFRNKMSVVEIYAEMIQRQSPYDPRDYVRGVPDEIARIAMKATALDPEQRYSDAFDFLCDLRKAREDYLAQKNGLADNIHGMRTAFRPESPKSDPPRSDAVPPPILDMTWESSPPESQWTTVALVAAIALIVCAAAAYQFFYVPVSESTEAARPAPAATAPNESAPFAGTNDDPSEATRKSVQLLCNSARLNKSPSEKRRIANEARSISPIAFSEEPKCRGL